MQTARKLLIEALEKDVKGKKPPVLSYLPYTVNFSKIDAGTSDGDPIEFEAKDTYAYDDILSESQFLSIVKTIPKDKHRVIALMLFIKNEMGFVYTQKDIASIWGDSQPNIYNRIKEIRKILRKRLSKDILSKNQLYTHI